MRVRIGVSNATKELDLEVEDAQAVIEAYHKAEDDGDRLFWMTETDGRRHGVVLAHVIYFELEADKSKSIGFGIE